MKYPPDGYYRDGMLICVPCSDSEDRDRPARVVGAARCAICGELLVQPGLGSATASALLNMTPLERSRLTGG